MGVIVLSRLPSESVEGSRVVNKKCVLDHDPKNIESTFHFVFLSVIFRRASHADRVTAGDGIAV